MRYKCIDSFLVDKCDDDGFHTGKEKWINQGTVWEISEDATNVTGAELHLDRIYKSKKAKSSEWIEIPKSYIDKYFKELPVV